jgi:CobQ-like glutamine amidotransferase family enzyme
MNLKFLHFYPDLMNLYGSYANVAVLRRALEDLGNTVIVETVIPGVKADLSGADFLFMGAGTERAQQAALVDFAQYGETVKTLAEDGVSMLFCGTAMELLGQTVTDADGTVRQGIGLGTFTAIQGKRRIVEDVYGHTVLFQEPIVGFMNKCGVISGVDTPLLDRLELGYGNDGSRTAEGFRYQNVLASQLTGPILVKNPRLLDTVIGAIYQRRGESLTQRSPDSWAEAGYAMTAEQLALRAGK